MLWIFIVYLFAIFNILLTTEEILCEKFAAN